MRTIRLLSPAHRELEQAILYYEARQPGVGRQFADEFDRAIDAILESPTRWPQYSTHSRRYRMHRFEFGIYYSVETTEIVISVIAHPSRDTASFADRLR
jgi:plasmid stabilization system protein ParE